MNLTPGLRARIRSSFDQAAADEEHFPSTIDPRILHVRVVFDHMGDLASGRVLDAGCGKGRFARLLASQAPQRRFGASTSRQPCCATSRPRCTPVRPP